MPIACASAYAGLALRPADRALLAHEATAHIIGSDFTAEAMCARTIAVYEELLFPESHDKTAQETAQFAVPA